MECVIDGRIIAVSAIPEFERSQQYSVMLRGMSVATRLFHGRIVVTRGLRY